ncbi:MAG TPA: maleylpyruvate isomerase family mycothiol-dependent enzyme, partial [Mycobacteriales bacterium]|nr:maleylpyruvate isomerase family mycothiol-dependent enzyme [Mycobacteriales bacterium]
LAAGRQGLDVAVPTCGDWRESDLLTHVARVYRRAATAVSERATAEVPWPVDDEDPADPVAACADALDELVHALSTSEPESPAWNWSGADQTAGFWARRMAHESAVHRYDAQRAHGLAQPVDADLAHDGIDELVDLIVPRVLRRDDARLPTATVVFSATDDAGRWELRLDGKSVERVDATSEPDVTVGGTASALLLAAYNRVPWTSLEVSGDSAVLDAWSAALRF